MKGHHVAGRSSVSFIVHEIKSTSTVRGITCHIPTFYERGTKSGRPRSKYGMEGRTDFKGKEPFCAISYLACQEEISRMGRSNGVAARLGSLDREVYSTLVTVMSSSTTTSSLLSSSPRHFLSHKILPFSDWEIGDRRLDNNRSARQEHKTQTGKAAARRAGGVEESGRTDGRTVRRRGGETRERERKRTNGAPRLLFSRRRRPPVAVGCLCACGVRPRPSGAPRGSFSRLSAQTDFDSPCMTIARAHPTVSPHITNIYKAGFVWVVCLIKLDPGIMECSAT